METPPPPPPRLDPGEIKWEAVVVQNCLHVKHVGVLLHQLAYADDALVQRAPRRVEQRVGLLQRLAVVVVPRGRADARESERARTTAAAIALEEGECTTKKRKAESTELSAEV